jgi:hypothetical protein
MTAGKPQTPPMVGMNSIVITKNLPSTFEETYNELLNYTDLLEPLLVQLESLTEEERESILGIKEVENSKVE